MLKFKVIRWRNFLSTGAQFIEVRLDKDPTTLIVGENGAGKSTILDALCYVLFNKPFRNINKPQLINSINQKQMVVEIEFSIGTKEYKIIRGAKPNVFEIYLNGSLINQDAAARDYQKYLEDHVLKLNYKSFTQIVILGSASFTPFMQLPTGHRREIIEELLDIKIFSTMNDVLKEKNNDLKSRMSDTEDKIDLGKQKVRIQQSYIKTLEEDKQKKIEDVQNRISETNAEITKLSDALQSEQEVLDSLQSSIQDAEDKRTRNQEMASLLKKLTERVKAQEERIQFYHEHDTCPTCNQELNDVLKQSAVHSHTKKITEIEDAIGTISGQIEAIQARLSEIDDIEAKISERKSTIINISSRIIASQEYIKKLQYEITGNTQSSCNIDEEKTKLKLLAKEVVDLGNYKNTLIEEKHYIDIASILLKDTGIKTKVIKQYLPIINKLVNKYLQAMDFFVTFELDEALNETIKSRHRDEFSYASFSEGEKQRIDLALLFAWRTIAKMKNSTNTNLLMLDEVFDSSLDVNGTDFVMTLLNTLGDESNVFVISHKSALFDKFRSVIEFEKYQNFSRIKPVKTIGA